MTRPDTPDATQAGPPPAADKAGKRYASEKHCCTVCGQPTLLACSDCRIDFRTTIYVCGETRCRDEHETKCSARLRERLARVVPRLAALEAASEALLKRLDDLIANTSFGGAVSVVTILQRADLRAALALGAAGPGGGT